MHTIFQKLKKNIEEESPFELRPYTSLDAALRTLDPLILLSYDEHENDGKKKKKNTTLT